MADDDALSTASVSTTELLRSDDEDGNNNGGAVDPLAARRARRVSTGSAESSGVDSFLSELELSTRFTMPSDDFGDEDSSFEECGELTLNFSVHFMTRYGEQVYLVGSLQELGAWDTSSAICMKHVPADGDFQWETNVVMEAVRGRTEFQYKYFAMMDNDPTKVRWENNYNRTARLQRADSKLGRAIINDGWVSARLCLSRRLEFGELLYVLGRPDELGGWNPAKAKPMKWNSGNLWDLRVPMRYAMLDDPFPYKVLRYKDNYYDLDDKAKQALWDERGELQAASWGDDWQIDDYAKELGVGAGGTAQLGKALASAEFRISELEGQLQASQNRTRKLEEQLLRVPTFDDVLSKLSDIMRKAGLSGENKEGKAISEMVVSALTRTESSGGSLPESEKLDLFKEIAKLVDVAAQQQKKPPMRKVLSNIENQARDEAKKNSPAKTPQPKPTATPNEMKQRPAFDEFESPGVLRKTKTLPVKRFHWNKIQNRLIEGTIWEYVRYGSWQVDYRELLAHFGASHKGLKENGTKSNNGQPLQIMDPKTARNVEITLKRIRRLSADEIREALLSGNLDVFDTEFLQLLLRVVPGEEDQMRILETQADETKMISPERFWMAMSPIPRVSNKVRAFLLRASLPWLEQSIIGQARVVSKACNELFAADKLHRVMEFCLALGNAMNAGTAKGNALGFSLLDLPALALSMTSDRRASLLHYAIAVLSRHKPEVMDFPDDLPTLRAAGRMDTKIIVSEFEDVTRQFRDVRHEIDVSVKDANSQGFYNTFKAWSDKNAPVLEKLKSSVNEMEEALKGTLTFLPSGKPSITQEEAFGALVRFIDLFEKYRKDVRALSLLENAGEGWRHDNSVPIELPSPATLRRARSMMAKDARGPVPSMMSLDEAGTPRPPPPPPPSGPRRPGAPPPPPPPMKSLPGSVKEAPGRTPIPAPPPPPLPRPLSLPVVP